MKDKAKLLFELDNLTKTNSELREELLQVHSQLEQEKSRSSAALLELRRMLEVKIRAVGMNIKFQLRICSSYDFYVI